MDLGPGGLERLDAERDNFRAAMRWALDDGHAVAGLQLASALGRFWVIRAHGEGYGWLSEALEAEAVAPAAVRAAGLTWAGSTLFFTGDYQGATALCEEALGLYRELGDDGQVAALLDRLAGGREHRATSRVRVPPRTRASHLSRARRRDRDLLSARKGRTRRVKRGDRTRGRELRQEALELARHAGDKWFETIALGAPRRVHSRRTTVRRPRRWPARRSPSRTRSEARRHWSTG